VLFASAGGAVRCELKPAYTMQLAVRVDDQRKMLIYDAFEYKGDGLAPDAPLPSTRSIRKFYVGAGMGSDGPLYQ